jgi:hypothetical protein
MAGFSRLFGSPDKPNKRENSEKERARQGGILTGSSFSSAN